ISDIDINENPFTLAEFTERIEDDSTRNLVKDIRKEWGDTYDAEDEFFPWEILNTEEFKALLLKHGYDGIHTAEVLTDIWVATSADQIIIQPAPAVEKPAPKPAEGKVPKKPSPVKVAKPPEKPAEQATTKTTPKTVEEVKKTVDTDFTAIPPRTFSLRKEAIERERERLGLDGPESANKESFRQWQKEAQEAKIPEKATQIANEIINEPRALSPKEIAGLGIRLAEVTIDLEKSEEAMSKLTDEADVAAKATDMNRLEAERDLLIEAAPEIQHAAGRGLVALKIRIDRSFNLTAVLGRARAALRKKLSSTQKTLFTKLTKENKRLSDQVDALRKKVQDSKANTYIKSRVSARQLSS
ncbi:hypothetical protein LCGC14_3049570, partial [marine sediment metagenome]